MHSNLPTLNIHIHIYSIKTTKYQYKTHTHIYRCILSNINVFNLLTLMIHTHTLIYIESANFLFFIFFRKNLPNINLLKLANFKNLHTYKYICNLPNINVVNLPIFKIHIHIYTYNLPNINVVNLSTLKIHIYIYI